MSTDNKIVKDMESMNTSIETAYENMRKSERVIALVLHYLLSSGFQLGHLRLEDLNLDEELKPFLPGCIQWMLNERLIHCENGSIVRSVDVRLINPMVSSLGLSAMNQKVDLGTGEQTIGSIVQRVGEGDRSFSKIGDFLGGLIGGFTKSMGNG